MGSVLNAFGNNKPSIDFRAVKAASLLSIPQLVQRWLPQGKRHGDEWVSTNPTRNDRTPGSFSVNLKTGVWSDFATGDRGGDMIDLLAYLRRIPLDEAAREVGDLVGVREQYHHQQRGAEIHRFPTDVRAPAVVSPQDAHLEPAGFPARTTPDQNGKPRFVEAGDEGPRVMSDEERRHIYRIGGVPVRIKIIRRNKDNRALNWYRVSDGAKSGWQSKKPEGFRTVPFIGCVDPFDPEHDGPIYWPEGEKDVETLARLGLAAFTFGGCGDGLPAGCEQYLAGRDVVILADNDDDGRRHAERKAKLVLPVASRARTVHFLELPPKGDVSDWMASGGSAEALQALVEHAEPHAAPRAPASSPGPVTASPYVWTDPQRIPPRDFIYGKHLIRKFVSATVAPGGVGKTSLVTSDVMAMVSGKDLVGIMPRSRSKVWLWNLEDPFEEVQRHIQATAKHFGLTAHDLEGHLFVDSGRDQRLVIATTDKNQTVILEPVVESLVSEIQGRGIDVLIVDPFVSSHTVTENDNNGMDRIVKEWGRVAGLANCAVELVHHARKSSAGETEITVESARGAKALTDGCRSIRVLNRMSKEEATQTGVENPRLFFRTYIDKATLAPPAEASTWFRLESVELGNAPNFGAGDSVGVVVPWQWPDLMADVTVHDLRTVQGIVSKGRYRSSAQSPNWIGKAVGEALRLDLDKGTDKAKAKKLVQVWLASGALKEIREKDEKGNERPFVVVGEWAT